MAGSIGRLLALSAGLTIVFGGQAAVAGDAGKMPPSYLPRNGGAGIRTGHITATGATVPDPGVSQGAGETSLDNKIQQDDNSVDASVCKGCR